VNRLQRLREAGVFPRIRALPQAPQVADHLAYGATVGAVLSSRRRGRTVRIDLDRDS
jgi:hypothetical protein